MSFGMQQSVLAGQNNNTHMEYRVPVMQILASLSTLGILPVLVPTKENPQLSGRVDRETK
jgi:hypothetical protein